ncbi:hypothetical protein Ae201684P_001218 [Aphanomyces euteiches]|uniref:Uncharacterized protein n=1 Tax=Aphanomyces euteiches TaxID=100861 RepID=A0A6G0WQ61_9STRA|nr:hypothetical protein Ae201684_012812 [Aphanomyces euteiches]KAH9097742.1 hypothetical protein Ae201684P_001218 [Aphanomyces euteiches]
MRSIAKTTCVLLFDETGRCRTAPIEITQLHIGDSSHQTADNSLLTTWKDEGKWISQEQIPAFLDALMEDDHVELPFYYSTL